MDSPVYRGHSGGEAAVIIADSVTGIDIERAAMAGGNVAERHATGAKPALVITCECGHLSYSLGIAPGKGGKTKR